MNRHILGRICYLLSAAVIVFSSIPLIEHNFSLRGGHLHLRGALEYGGLERVNWNSLTIQAWLVLLVGIIGGLILVWLGSRLRSGNGTDKNKFSAKRIGIIIALTVGILLSAVFLPGMSSYFGVSALDSQTLNEVPLPANTSAAVKISELQAIQTNLESRRSIRVRVADFKPQELLAFESDFTTKYRPAVSNWCRAFSGRIPFSLDKLSSSNLVERLGQDEQFFVYTFILDGITLCVRDDYGAAQVFYFNAPQSKMLMGLPNGTAPTAVTPVSAIEVSQIVKGVSGTDFILSDIHITPSGYSSTMDGGAYVSIGGDPDNAATWKYTLVFGPDGKLAYYLKGH
jgi:hypothetical protein